MRSATYEVELFSSSYLPKQLFRRGGGRIKYQSTLDLSLFLPLLQSSSYADARACWILASSKTRLSGAPCRPKQSWQCSSTQHLWRSTPALAFATPFSAPVSPSCGGACRPGVRGAPRRPWEWLAGPYNYTSPRCLSVRPHELTSRHLFSWEAADKHCLYAW